MMHSSTGSYWLINYSHTLQHITWKGTWTLHGRVRYEVNLLGEYLGTLGGVTPTCSSPILADEEVLSSTSPLEAEAGVWVNVFSMRNLLNVNAPISIRAWGDETRTWYYLIKPDDNDCYYIVNLLPELVARRALDHQTSWMISSRRIAKIAKTTHNWISNIIDDAELQVGDNAQ